MAIKARYLGRDRSAADALRDSHHRGRSGPPKIARRGVRVIEIFSSGRASEHGLAGAFLRLADLDNGIFERLGRYEAALWRQVRQTIFTLQQLQWRGTQGNYRRTLDRW